MKLEDGMTTEKLRDAKDSRRALLSALDTLKCSDAESITPQNAMIGLVDVVVLSLFWQLMLDHHY